jgi:flagellin-like protein
MAFNKKAISPVVATALLLVVAVVAVVGFQSWFTTFQSKTLTGVEVQTSSAGASLDIQRVQEDLVYIYNGATTNINVTGITISSDNGDYVCGETTSVLITPGVDAYDCNDTSTGTYTPGEALSVLVETSTGLVDASKLAK